MQRALRLSPALFALVVAACAQAPLVGPAPAGGPELVLEGRFPGGPSARVALQAALEAALPPNYRLLADPAASPVHAWVGGDVVRYDVELRRRNATTPGQFDALSPALEGQIPVTGSGPGAATFQKLQPGAYYRAYVKAMGRKGGSAGTDAVVQLNAQATGDFVDFDFTGSNEVHSQQERLLRVQLDAVAFAGTGGLHFGSIQPGAYASPSGGVVISGEAAPSPSAPAGPVASSFAVLANPTHLGVNAAGELWVGNGSSQAVRYSATGSTLGTITAPMTGGLGVGGGTLWYLSGSALSYSVTRANASDGSPLPGSPFSPGLQGDRVLAVGPGGDALLDLTGGFGSIASGVNYNAAGAALGTELIGAEASTGRWVDASGRVWRRTAAGLSLHQATSPINSGVLLALAGAATGVAFDAQGNAWVSIASLNQVHKLDSQGAFLASYAVGVGPHASAIDGAGHLWVLNSNATVTQVGPSGTVLGSFSVGSSPVAIQAKGGHVWVANQGSNSVTHITVPVN